MNDRAEILASARRSEPRPRRRPRRRAEAAEGREGGRRRPALHQLPRHAADRPQRRPSAAPIRRAVQHADGHQPARAAPFVRDAPAAAWRRPARHPGAARPCALSTTQRYTHVNAAQLIDVYRKSHPRASCRQKPGRIGGSHLLRFAILTLRSCLAYRRLSRSSRAASSAPRRRRSTCSASRSTRASATSSAASCMAGWSHDGAQAALGFEKQGRVGWAILSLSGRVSDRVRYYVSVNPVSETSSRPACGEKDFFFPNDPNLFAGTGPDRQVRRGRRPEARRYLQHLLARLHHPAGHPARGLRRLGHLGRRLAARRPLHPADRLCAARRRRDQRQGHGAHHPPQCRSELRRDARGRRSATPIARCSTRP